MRSYHSCYTERAAAHGRVELERLVRVLENERRAREKVLEERLGEQLRHRVVHLLADRAARQLGVELGDGSSWQLDAQLLRHAGQQIGAACARAGTTVGAGAKGSG